MPDEPGPSRIDIDIRVASPDWRKALAGPSTVVRRAVRAVLAAELPAGCRTGLSILLTGDEEMRKLNAGWRDKDKPTNVLSFPAEAAVDPGAPPEYLGDIALGLATCRREAKEQGKTFADHVVHLTVHGVLHLLGYDHMTREEADAMEPREIQILAGLGVADPYTRPAKKRPAGKTAAKKPSAKKKMPAAKKKAAAGRATVRKVAKVKRTRAA